MQNILRLIRVFGPLFFLKLGTVKRLTNQSYRGFYVTRVMAALVNIGLLQALSEQQSVNLSAFADKNNLTMDVLQPLCDYLYELKILDRTGQNYSLSEDGRLMNQYLLGGFQVIYAYEDIYYNLEGLLKKEKLYGVDVHRRGEFVARASGHSGKLLAFPVLADLVRENHYQCVLDLGCGDATFLMDIIERNEHLKGVGLDVSPDAVEAGIKNLAERNLNNRIQLFVGDMFNIREVTGKIPKVDAATCMYVLHELVRHNRTRAIQMLREFRQSFPGIPIVICEVIYHPPDVIRTKPGGISEIQLFHALSKQQIFTREEWHAVFKEADFTNIKEDYLAPVRTAIFTVN